ncbi:cupin domain-containing protein [Dyadobacter sp. CY327]|uniref:cupin domain-containing protein n=1 Tax=Dyadobacter sp. CY327 TaxID=2907301 RepID=UPI001F2A53F7|nr:cupin domain-containing protein [Dyadobacter sp. CY327]MCE7072551.1 cupin domain-containing protein [Dyadobacter sp. CY327]
MQRSKGLNRLLLAFLLTLTHIFVSAQVKDAGSPSTSIFPKGQLAPASNFTGKAWVHPLIQADSAFNIPVSSVTFEPGARTYWHSHGGGQGIIAIDGEGYYQEKGKPIQVLRKGDAVKCPPNTPHWHGASPETGFVQMAVTPNHANGRVKWLQPVTPAEYSNTK